MEIIIPTQQKTMSPDDQVNFSFTGDNWSIEFSRYTDRYNEIIGNNLIMRGLGVTPSFAPYPAGSNWITATIQPGKLISDYVLIEIPSIETVTFTGLDAILYPPTGWSLLVYTEYEFSEVEVTDRPYALTEPYELGDPEFPTQEAFNPIIFKIEYYDGVTVPGWDPSLNPIILARIEFEKDGPTGNIMDAWLTNETEFNIDGVTYNIRGNEVFLTDEADGGEIP